MRLRFRTLAALMAALVASCGGGGSSGKIYFSGASPTSLQIEAYEEVPPNGGPIRMTLGGDLDALKTKNVYVSTTATGPFFQRSQAIIDESGGSVDVVLSTRREDMPTTGEYQGSIEIRGCLDPACATPFGGDPVVVPYKVTVLRGLSLPTNALNAHASFGAKPDKVRIPVTLPPGATDWTVTRDMGTDSPYILAEKAADGSANIDVTYLIAPPGSHAVNYSVNAIAPGLNGDPEPRGMYKPLAISYEVTDDGGPRIAFDPPMTAVELDSTSAVDSVYETMDFAIAEGNVLSLNAVFYTAPAAANGNPNSSSWILLGPASNEFWIKRCSKSGGELVDCLPQGTYTGAIIFKYSSPSGVDTDIEYSVTMVIK